MKGTHNGCYHGNDCNTELKISDNFRYTSSSNCVNGKTVW